MHSRITELSCKEVINVCDGMRCGFVNDVEVDCANGRIINLIIHCKGKLTSFFSKKYDIIIPWEAIKRISDDLILVEYVEKNCCEKEKLCFFKK